MTRARATQHGFTLLELLVAFAIMAMSLGMLYRATGAGARNVGDMERHQKAVVLAQSLLALRDSVGEQGWNEVGESAGYRWRISSAPYPVGAENPAVPMLHEISIAVFWSDADRQRQLDVNTLLPQRKPLDPGQRP